MSASEIVKLPAAEPLYQTEPAPSYQAPPEVTPTEKLCVGAVSSATGCVIRLMPSLT